jgi:hypothetical protein
MTFIEWHQEIKTFASKAPAQSLAHRVGLGGSHGRPQNSHPQVRQTLVDVLSEDAVAIMDQEAVGMISRQRFPELVSVHSAVGWQLRFWWRIMRDPISMTRKT